MADDLPPCEALSEFFDAQNRANNFAHIIDQPPGSFRCELHSVSCRSTNNPVQNDEILARIIVAPRDLKPSGPLGLGDTAVSEMCRLGLSTLRISADGVADKIERLARSLVDRAANSIPVNDEAYCAGILEFTCASVREFRIESVCRQIMGAYETPEDHYPNHSDVLQAVNLFSSKSQSKNAARNFLSQGRIAFFPADEYPRANIRGVRMAGRLPLLS